MFFSHRTAVGALALTLLLCSLLLPARASAFADTGQVNPEVLRTNPQIRAWADRVVESDRGPLDYADPSLGDASFGMPTDVLGSSGSAFSLGDGGSITLGFPLAIENGPGVDFVVFENSFAFGGTVFSELAFVEVSTDGVAFARMPALSRVDRPLGAFDGIASEEVYNLAGNFVGGTGFDLEDLLTAADPLVASGVVDPMRIRYVRVVDVIGDYLGAATVDHLGRPVSDPYPTAFASGGFDLTGVAIMNPPGAVRTEQRSFGAIKNLYR